MTLRYQDSAADIYDALKAIPRTGWVIRHVPNPETVYDHTVALLELANELRDRLNLSNEAFDDLLHILEIHDWAEAVVGDIYIPNEDKADYETEKAKKATLERQALVELLSDRPFASAVLSRFDRYEAGTDTVAKLAKELDKLQSLMLAGEYEDQYNIPLFAVFNAHYERDNSFNHPVILEAVAKLRDTIYNRAAHACR